MYICTYMGYGAYTSVFTSIFSSAININQTLVIVPPNILWIRLSNELSVKFILYSNRTTCFRERLCQMGLNRFVVSQ